MRTPTPEPQEVHRTKEQVATTVATLKALPRRHKGDGEVQHGKAVDALLDLIDDPAVRAAFKKLPWY